MPNNIEAQIYELLATVPDPEVPVLSVLDLGVVRKVVVTDTTVSIDITPTYSGCPAMGLISSQIKLALITAGYNNITVTEVLTPAWTTDWMSEQGKQKLMAYGIAPPQGNANNNGLNKLPVPCPQCQSIHTQLLSEYGSTSCKSLYKCKDCLEPFDYFKCH
jgi:ring-1,2-phenylacetyl-CoA epoxidase subunit PaaD